jgi:hypothetical protein
VDLARDETIRTTPEAAQLRIALGWRNKPRMTRLKAFWVARRAILNEMRSIENVVRL